MTDHPGYQGSPRDPDAVIRAAFSNPELMRQLAASYEEQLRGIPPIPWREVDDQIRRRDAQRRTA